MDLKGASSMDHLNFSGTGTLGGTFTLTLGEGFTPSLGQSFDFFDGKTTRTFVTLSLPTLVAGLQWNTSQIYSNGVLSITSAAPLPAAGMSGWALLLPIALRRRRQIS